MKFRIGLVFFALLRLCFRANSECSISETCAALGSYYVSAGINLTYIGELMSTTDSAVLSYNPATLFNVDSIQSDARVNVPFTCDCINNNFLGHVFKYDVVSGDTYGRIASLVYANLTTVAALRRFNNEYEENKIPVDAKLDVVVNCSCGDSKVSDDKLFITYPVRPGDNLASIAEAESLDKSLLQRYNPGVNFGRETGYVYVPYNPGKVAGSRSQTSHGRIIGISVGVSAAVLIVFCIMYISRKKMIFLKKGQRNELDIDAFIRNYGSIAPSRYSYPDVVKMTNSFGDQIGKGGYGTVYKGKLPDGLLVAVKVLSESKGDGEEFINEVASIGRTSHVNVVTLLGFCYQRNKRALIYEYMPNGSLDKFINNQGSLEASCHLEWNTLSEIAVGVARGLEYLHRGCNTRILHFDIKPQNILLDKDFCPKIADFGLAKLCKTRESIVSMLGTRGTAGYIAPEVFSRNFGGVSHKSDVYSYGMMVLEMVGARRNLHSGVSHTSEMFPHYIYKDLELGNDESFFSTIPEEENEAVRKMILISLGCIQTMPSDRPSMSKVVEMLEGPLHSLTVPPKPLLFTPTEPAINEQTVSSGAEESMIKSQESETW